MPFGILGVVLGGALMRRWNLSVGKATAMSIVFSLLTLLIGVPLMFMGCDTRPISGVNTPVFDTACARNCGCDDGGGVTSAYIPVCDVVAGVEYVSPCNAGCTGVIYDNATSKTGDNHSKTK